MHDTNECGESVKICVSWIFTNIFFQRYFQSIDQLSNDSLEKSESQTTQYSDLILVYSVCICLYKHRGSQETMVVRINSNTFNVIVYVNTDFNKNMKKLIDHVLIDFLHCGLHRISKYIHIYHSLESILQYPFRIKKNPFYISYFSYQVICCQLLYYANFLCELLFRVKFTCYGLLQW